MLIAGVFDDSVLLPDKSFDVIVLLATLEHIQDKEAIARKCFHLLRAGGRVVVTVPSILADHALRALVALRLADGMSLEQHHGFEPAHVPEIFEKQGFRCRVKRKFQLGMNNLFVFERSSSREYEPIATRDSGLFLLR